MEDVAEVSSVGDGRLRVVMRGPNNGRRDEDAVTALLRRLMDDGVPVLGLEVEGSRLADVFMSLTGSGAA